jgi:hypothetical protein
MSTLLSKSTLIPDEPEFLTRQEGLGKGFWEFGKRIWPFLKLRRWPSVKNARATTAAFKPSQASAPRPPAPGRGPVQLLACSAA